MENQNEEKKDLVDKFYDDLMEDVREAEAVLYREVTPVGNSGHVTVGKEFIGKHARIIITNKKRDRRIEMTASGGDDK